MTGISVRKVKLTDNSAVFDVILTVDGNTAAVWAAYDEQAAMILAQTLFDALTKHTPEIVRFGGIDIF